MRSNEQTLASLTIWTIDGWLAAVLGLIALAKLIQ